MRWSLEEWMKYRGSSFSWNLMHNRKIIQYIKLLNIKYFIKCFLLCTMRVACFCLPWSFFKFVKRIFSSLRSWYGCEHRNRWHLTLYNQPIFLTHLLSRRCSICSDYTLFHLEAEGLSEIFKKNSYPSGIKELSIRTFLNKLYVPKALLIVLPFLGTMSSNCKLPFKIHYHNVTLK